MPFAIRPFIGMIIIIMIHYSMVMKSPLLLITFNRPDHVRKVLTEIRKQKPAELFVFQDGARDGNEKDIKQCRKVRDVVSELVDWPCHLHTLYQNSNLGCGLGPATGISWFFEQVDSGIVMEDDCLPHPDFFGYCEELLDRYQDDSQVQFINATLYHKRWRCDASYGFSHYMVTGAWAGWRRTWKGFDLDLLSLNAWAFRKHVLRLTHNRGDANWWYFKVKEIQKDTGKKSYWDYQMQVHLFLNDARTIHPKVNLISNIGFDEEGTHTLMNDGRGNIPVFPILPLSHPLCLTVNTDMDADCFAKRSSRGLIMDTLSFIKHALR